MIVSQKASALCGWNLKSKIIKSKISQLFRAWHTRYPVVGVRDRGDNGLLRSGHVAKNSW